MNYSSKTLIKFLSFFIIIITLVYNVSAQENETNVSIKQVVGITTAQNETFSSQSNDEDNIIMAQRNLDRSLTILNTVASLLGVLVGILTLIIVIVGSLGFLEIRKWREARKNVENDVEIVRGIKNKAEKELNTLREDIQKSTLTSLTEKPSKKVLDKFNEFASKLELIEMLGAQLNHIDYFNRAKDFYYKGEYEFALKALEKAIELEPDFAPGWYNLACVYSNKRDKEKTLFNLKNAIELDEYFKEQAKEDKDFENLWADDEFKKLIE